MKFVVTAILLAVTLAACGDGVPTVDPENIIVEGQPMKPHDFIAKYCAGQSQNETCMKVLVVSRKSSTRGGARVQW